MNEIKIFQEFTSKLFKIYDSDPDGFWEISMHNFLSYFAKPSMIFKRSKNVIILKQLMTSLENDSEVFINFIDNKWKTNIAGLKSARKQYIQDALPVFIMLAIWAKEEGLWDILENYDQVLIAGLYAVIGYSILDDNLDSNKPNPVEILTSQLLLSEYEQECYKIFGDGKVQHDIFHRIRLLFLESEINEKKSRWTSSPYLDDKPIDLGIKGLNAVTPFVLCLEKAGKINHLDKYIEIFLLIGAVIQMIDDWEDLRDDLLIGHYSYVTLGQKDLNKDVDIMVAAIKRDRNRILKTYKDCCELIEKATILLNELDDRIIMQLLLVTNNRMKDYYKKEFNI